MALSGGGRAYVGFGSIAPPQPRNAVRECKAPRQGERWAVYVRLGGPTSNWLVMRSQREPVRTWASLDTLERFTRSLGIREVILES